jgi:ectoine hydroxylase-related dioxygenase (phytanoyl-CoA dioxygenase family)
MHAYVPEYYDAVCHPAVVGRVASILGPDVIAWGLTLIQSVPGNVHRWHVDVEHRHWDGVSVYMGLENITPQSSLLVVEGSQDIPEPPQAFGQITDDAAALKAARSRVPGAEVRTVGLQPGQFFLFAGRLWHGSHNTGDQVRVAMIAHYSRPDADVRIPLSFDDPVRWHGWRPPCILVAGRDTAGVNRLVGRPHREVQA